MTWAQTEKQDRPEKKKKGRDGKIRKKRKGGALRTERNRKKKETSKEREMSSGVVALHDGTGIRIFKLTQVRPSLIVDLSYRCKSTAL